MTTVTITQAKVNLEEFAMRAHKGERIVIKRWGRPVAQLQPLIDRYSFPTAGDVSAQNAQDKFKASRPGTDKKVE